MKYDSKNKSMDYSKKELKKVHGISYEKKKKELASKHGAFSTKGSKKERINRFTKHIDKGPKGFLTGHK